MPRPQRGSAVLVVPVVILAATVGVVGVTRMGTAAAAQARADATADMVALAVAGSGDDRAGAAVAGSVHASVLGLVRRGDGAVEVLVERDGARARAAAVDPPR